MIVSGPTMAQRTGDHVVPSIETVCDDDPFSFGLCNSYCEALDCDSDTPLGTVRACTNVLDNYLKKSDGVMPPCEEVPVSCPCEFGSEEDFDALIDAAAAEQFAPALDEITLQTYCNSIGDPSVTYFVTEANDNPLPESGIDPQGLKLFHWVSVSEESAACAAEGGGFDGQSLLLAPGGDDWSYGPFLQQETSLSEDEATACQTALQELCAELAD